MFFAKYILVALGLVTSFASLAEQYLCTADLVTGFSWNEKDGRWNSTNFNVENENYLVSSIEPSTGGHYVIKKLGDRKIIATCESGFDASGLLSCRDFVVFRMNREAGRYLLVYPSGYVEGYDNNDNTPFVEIGKCSVR